MSGFDDKSIDIVIRLEECADIDEAEGATQSVVAMTREAADTITLLRKQRNELLAACKRAMEHWDNVHTSAESLMQATDDLRNAIAKAEP